MKRFLLSHYFFSFLLIVISLNSKALSANNSNVKLDSIILPDLNPVQKSIFEQINSLKNGKTIKIEGEKITGNSYITKLYKNGNYSALWKSSKNRQDLIQILEESYYEGLNPEDYHIVFIKEYQKNLQKNNNLTAELKAHADIVMTNAILTYSSHLILGKVHPTDLDPNWNYSKRSIPDTAEFLILNRLESESIIEGVDQIKTKMPLYAKLKHWLKKYDSLSKSGKELKQIEYPGKALKIGDTSTVVSKLKLHLNNYGISIDNTGPEFDEELDLALKEFQLHNGLDTDGVAGKRTFKAINLSLKERIDIIRANLERCRWLNNETPKDYLVVNIADFNLYLWKNNKLVYRSRVVVGKEQHETPVFTSSIKYLVFNPTWTVPYSIATKETLPKLKKDPNYLKRNNMTLLRNGKIIDPATVNFNDYTTRNFPFTVRQEPGPNNALGQVKFIFPNKYSVYLHDTPSKSYFNRSERTFSHGCIRVQNPLLLAEQLLGDKGYNQTKIKEVLNTKKITNVNLSTPLPVMLMYWTCYENEINNKLHFFSDVYKRDARLIAELKKKK